MPRDPALTFWGAGRVLLQLRGQWELRGWPDWQVLQSGRGAAASEPGGERLAVATGERSIAVSGTARLELPAEAGQLVDLDWTADERLVAATRIPASTETPSGTTARVIGQTTPDQTVLWQLDVAARSSRLLWGSPAGTRIASVHGHPEGGVLVECAADTDPRTVGGRRVLRVDADGKARDLAPGLSGSTCQPAIAPNGRVVLLHADFPHHELVAPMGFSLVEGSDGGWRTLLPPTLRVWGSPSWTADGRGVLATAFDGIRLGVVLVDAASGHWSWAALEQTASYRCPTQATPQTPLVAIRQPLGGTAEVVAVSGGQRRGLHQLGDPEPPASVGGWEVHAWHGPDGPLEGVLATPAQGGKPWPLVVDVHGGPVGALMAGDPGVSRQLAAWTASGFAALAPDYRGSGILGVDAMLAAFRGEGLPDDDREARDVLSAVESLVEAGVADPERLFVFGHGYGAYLVNRIVTRDHRFRAAVCWEGVADLRMLDLLMGGTVRQRAWRGGSPWQTPQAWAAASPITQVASVRTPMLLAYGHDGMGPTQGMAWYAALRDHQVPCELVVYDREGHVLTATENTADLLARAVAWFTRHAR